MKIKFLYASILFISAINASEPESKRRYSEDLNMNDTNQTTYQPQPYFGYTNFGVRIPVKQLLSSEYLENGTIRMFGFHDQKPVKIIYSPDGQLLSCEYID